MVVLGFTIFLLMGLMAFWSLAFLLGFIVPYWLTLGALQMLQPKRLVESSEE